MRLTSQQASIASPSSSISASKLSALNRDDVNERGDIFEFFASIVLDSLSDLRLQAIVRLHNWNWSWCVH